MTNLGVAPPDSDTEIGQLRIDLGDTNFVALNPVVSGFGDYDWMSDVEIDRLIDSADGNLKRAEAYGLDKLSRYLTLSASSIQTDDLRIQTIDRAKLMRELAKDAHAEADRIDEAAASDLFEVIPFGGYENQHTKTWPEATPRPVIL